MRLPGYPSLLLLSRAYTVVALVVAAALSPLVYVPLPLFTLLLYLRLEFRGTHTQLRVPLNLFLTLSLPLLLSPLMGTWASPALALPVMVSLDYSLRQRALGYQFGSPEGERRRPTGICLWLAVCLLVVGLVALALGSWALLLTCALLTGYLTAIMGVVLRRTSARPGEAQVASYRALAGNLTQAPLRLLNRSGLGGQLALFSPHPWLHMRPSRLVLDRPNLEVEASFAPPLAGPAAVVVQAAFVDPWGLLRTDFRITLLELLVIPRARAAEWLAHRYLEMSRTGSREAMTSVTPTVQRGSRRGLEFYGLRSYQPGDTARAIDWKHSLKLHQVIVKEFLDTGVESAILAINLSVTDEEQKDELVYAIITTALTLARENIPSALTTYSDQGVVLTTRLRDPQRALVQALNLSREVRISPSPLRYLGVPDVARLRSNIHRLGQAQSGAAVKLAELLQVEYAALSRAAQESPATAALAAALTAVNGNANVLLVSGHNHDAEALAFNRYALNERGYRVLTVDLERKTGPVRQRQAS